jgi:hypothetical protein
MAVLKTRQVGCAPDERGGDRPPEVVYTVEPAPKPRGIAIPIATLALVIFALWRGLVN